MFTFFSNLPEEIQIKIISNTTVRDQAVLAQTNQECNRLTNDTTLELFKFKKSSIVHRVGDVCLVISESGKKDSSMAYILKTVNKNQKISNSGMWLEKKHVDELVTVMKDGTQALIDKLKGWGETASLNASVLEGELQKENKIAVSSVTKTL